VEQIVLVNNSNLLDARLPALLPGVDVIINGNSALCPEGLPYGSRPCRGQVSVLTRIELSGLSEESISFLGTTEGRYLLISLLGQQIGSNGTLPSLLEGSNRRRRSNVLDLEFEFVIPSERAANLSFALDDFDIDVYRALLADANVSTSSAAVVVPYDQQVRPEDQLKLEQLKAVTTTVAGSEEGLHVSWDPPRLGNSSLNATYTILFRPAATLDRLETLALALETDSSFHSIVVYQEMALYRSADVTSSSRLVIPKCSGASIQGSSCVELSTLYEVVVVANADAISNALLEYDLELASFPQLGTLVGQPFVSGFHLEGVTSKQAILTWRQRGGNSSSVVQVWVEGMLNSAILNHSISDAGAGLSTMQACIPDSDLCITPFRRYSVSVTSLGTREANVEMIYFETAEAAPTSIVRNVTHAVLGSRSSTLTFILPLESNGVITYLYVDTFVDNKLTRQLRLPVNSSAHQQFTQPNAIHSITILALKPFTEYHFSLRAVNSEGAGPSTTILATTVEDIPSAPRNPTLIPIVNSSRIELHWQSPTPPNGVILEYELVVNKINSSMFDLNVTLPSNATSTNITLATENDQVQLRARTSVGWGPWSEPAIFAQGSGSDPTPGTLYRAWVLYASIGFGCLVPLVAGLVLRWCKKRVDTNFRPAADEYEVLPEQVDIIDIIGSGAHGKVFKAVSQDH
jgi:hypothetical protein